jgi:hypothetical protein
VRARERALTDERLADEHRAFLRALERDASGRPRYAGYHAGIGGCYAVTPA